MLYHAGVPWLGYVKNKCKRLLVPYFVYGFAWAALFSIGGVWFSCAATTGGHLPDMAIWKPFVSVLLSNGWPDGVGFRVINALWFLPCFFIVEIIYYWVDRMIPDKYWQIFILPVCFTLDKLLSPFDILWSINLVPRYLIYFIVGRMFFYKRQMQSNLLVKIALVITMFFLLAKPDIIKSIAILLGLGQWTGLFKGLCGIVGCAILSQILPLRILSITGRYTIGILVTHKIFILGMQVIPFQIKSEIQIVVIAIIVTIISWIGSLFATAVLRRWCKWTLGEFI